MTDETRTTDLAETTCTCGECRPVKKPFSFKGFTSLFLTLTFVGVAFSGVILYLTPRGRTANWTDWSMLGLGKEQWGAMHMNTCAVLLLVAVVHLVLNWKMFAGYIVRKAAGGLNMKREMFLAGGLTALLLAGTVYVWPPFGALADLNMQIKDSWETRTAQAPVPHSEELTLVRFAEQIKLPVDQMTATLANEGFTVDDLERTVGDVARDKGVAPNAVLAAIQKHHPEVAMAFGGQGQGRGMGMGMGRGRWGGSSASAGGCSEQSGDSCSTSGETATCESAGSDGETCSETEGECSGEGSEHGPGPGYGMGMGRGMGMGQGMGRGMGMGRGQGQGEGNHSDQ